jgi:hypothetical protein
MLLSVGRCRPVLNSDALAHNPEVAGSNPAPATIYAGQRPLPVPEEAFLLWRVHVIVHRDSSIRPWNRLRLDIGGTG